ncbi:MAG: NADH:ubiquinone reductase (Na(+)-transporting) subunit C [Bacteroidales bacterium]|nr:NADH:ubiquinone reductase (Na(+)-transporting) subunit C [Bacteroidales bacterium]
MFSNRYIFTYASVMVIVVAAVLSMASQLLKPYQEMNVKKEKFQGILSAAEVKVSRADASDTYSQFIVEELAIDSEGNIVSRYAKGKQELGDIRPFDIVLRDELRVKQDAKNGKTSRSPLWPLYIMEKDGQRQYIIPLHGVGLWGPIWGNIAFKSDFNTVSGTSFDHKSETPGLGAEINTVLFQDEFKDRQIFDQNGQFVSIKVVKGGVANSSVPPMHGVDAISGGTITSNGVSEMLVNCLENYVPYITKNIKSHE